MPQRGTEPGRPQDHLDVRVAAVDEIDAVLGERDCISVPPGMYRGEINVGDEEAVIMVMIGSPKPVTPTYPPEHPLSKVKRN